MTVEFGLSLDWSAPRGGVVFVPPPEPSPEERASTRFEDRCKVWMHDNDCGFYIARGEETWIRRHSIESPFEPKALDFLNARTREDMAEFLSRYGMLGPRDDTSEPLLPPGAWSEMWIESYQGSVRHYLKQAEQPDNPLDPAAYFNRVFSQNENYHLKPRFEYVEAKKDDPQKPAQFRMQFSASPKTLFAFMLMELAVVAVRGVKTTSCKVCGKLRPTGYTTNRKSNSETCSPACRQSLYRAKKAKKPLPPPHEGEYASPARLMNFLAFLDEVKAEREKQEAETRYTNWLDVLYQRKPLSREAKLVADALLAPPRATTLSDLPKPPPMGGIFGSLAPTPPDTDEPPA